jgi:predicted signal transduction protein with EAL and GGDEF domain
MRAVKFSKDKNMQAHWTTNLVESNGFGDVSNDANDHLSLANRLLLQDLGQRLGLTLAMPAGAVRLTADTGVELFLEITEDDALWVIHTEICAHADTTPAMLDAYLRLNGKVALMRGAAICIEDTTETVRLYAAINTERLDIETLENTFAHLMHLHREQASLIHHF